MVMEHLAVRPYCAEGESPPSWHLLLLFSLHWHRYIYLLITVHRNLVWFLIPNRLSREGNSYRRIRRWCSTEELVVHAPI